MWRGIEFVECSEVRSFLKRIIDRRFRLTRFIVPNDGELEGKIVGYVDYPKHGGYATSTVVIDPRELSMCKDAKRAKAYVGWCVRVADRDLQEYIESPEYAEACGK